MTLSAVLDIRREIESLRAHIRTLRLSVTNITAKLDGLPHSKATTSKIEELAVKIADEERRLAELQIELADKAVVLSAEICRRVSGVAGEILIMRYIGGASFDKISSTTGYSRSYVSRLHQRGKQEFDDLITSDLT